MRSGRGSGSAMASPPRSTPSKRPGSQAPLVAILDSDTEIAFGPLPEAVHARYSRIGSGGGNAIRSIVVNARWQQSDPRAIATLIVHEAKHLEDDLAGVDPRAQETCFQFEVRAFTQQAQAWQAFYGPNGKARPSDELDAELNAWLNVHRRGPARGREAGAPALREGVQPARPAPPLTSEAG